MLKKTLKLSAIATLLALSGCSGIFDKDNTPAPTPLDAIQAEFTPVTRWSTSVGKNSDQWLKQSPALHHNMLYTTDNNGDVLAINALTGHSVWQAHVEGPVAAGPAASTTLVLVVNRAGKVFALSATTGKLVWTHDVKGQVLGSPVINEQLAIIKTSDGEVHALKQETGTPAWTFRQLEPNLSLHSAGKPVLHQQQLFVGFANGNLANLNTRSGETVWIQPVATAQGAFAIERMIDVDADITVEHGRVFAASFQGNITAFDAQSGRVVWSHDLSSYTGMTTDGETLYITDASGVLWAFNAQNGAVRFEAKALLARGLSAPTLMGQYVVVGDKLGFLHWFNKQTGRIVARTSLGSSIQATPLVDNDTLYVLTQDGRLNAYKR